MERIEGAANGPRIAGWALAAALLMAAATLEATTWLWALAGASTVVALWLAWRGHAERLVLVALGLATALGTVVPRLPDGARWSGGLVVAGLLVAAASVAWLGGRWQPGNATFRRLVGGTLLLAWLAAQASHAATQGGAAWLPRAEQGVAAALALATLLLLRRALARQHQPLVRRLALASALSFALYLALLVSPLWAGRAPSPTALLAAVGAQWLALVALFVATVRLPNKAPVRAEAPARTPPPRWRVLLDDYLTLMKVRVASLLLLTTLGAMVVAAQGWPGWALAGWVMLGGLLSVGGAGALNHYLDRDIDVDMGRTSQRPIPSGRVPARHALLFGLLLSVIQFALFWFKVNPLAAWLSTGGLLYYVFLYTIWLKRTTTQNIVVGGAAGAFPPLVGWAAVTGDLSLGALYLFAIIFYWTPPHFWALALMRKDDYARAGVPMLPVVQGDHNTRVQIVLYSLLMVGLTMVLVPLRMMGLLYLVAALLLNARFLWDAVQLYRAPSNGSALRLYKYSLLYLALLFLAMALDRSLLA